jgi:hypothetical protein
VEWSRKSLGPGLRRDDGEGLEWGRKPLGPGLRRDDGEGLEWSRKSLDDAPLMWLADGAIRCANVRFGIPACAVRLAPGRR